MPPQIQNKVKSVFCGQQMCNNIDLRIKKTVIEENCLSNKNTNLKQKYFNNCSNSKYISWSLEGGKFGDTMLAVKSQTVK